jgi:acetyl esterase/lipase
MRRKCLFGTTVRIYQFFEIVLALPLDSSDTNPDLGGGFCLPANMGYFKFFEQLIQSAGDSGHDLAVFVLSYTLAPHMRYPGQLSQAVEALRYIVMQTHRSPLDVLVGGDSAGGNLAVGLLSHLSHPHPAIPALNLEEPLAGVILISPWTSLDANPVSLSKDIGDLITTQVAGPWSSAYLGGADRDYYSDASNAPSTWFENLQVKEILVLGGGNEIMRPMVEAFVQKVQVSHPFMTYEIEDQDELTTKDRFSFGGAVHWRTRGSRCACV